MNQEYFDANEPVNGSLKELRTLRDYETSNWETMHFAGTKAIQLAMNYLDDKKRIYMDLILKKLNEDALVKFLDIVIESKTRSKSSKLSRRNVITSFMSLLAFA